MQRTSFDDMSAPEGEKPKIAIVGAGLTGLLAAHGLKKVGRPSPPLCDMSY